MPLKLKKSMKLKNSAREQAREPLGGNEKGPTTDSND